MHHFVIAIVPLFLVTMVDSSVAQTPGSAADVVHADAILFCGLTVLEHARV